MRHLSFISFLLFCTIVISNVQAQDTLQIQKKFNPEKVRLLFGLNFSPIMLMMQQNDNFIGEQQLDDKAPTLFTQYHNKNNLASDYSASNMQITLQANFWKNLYNGLHYEFFSIQNYKRPGNSILSKKNSFFFAIATSVAYSFEFLKNKNLHIMPSFRIGGYTADDYFDAKGKKIYLGMDCKIRYFIKNKFGFSAGVDYDYFRYKAKGFSDIYQQNTAQKTTLNNLYLNIGIAYNVNIKLDK